jgi:hypothetical protein
MRYGRQGIIYYISQANKCGMTQDIATMSTAANVAKFGSTYGYNGLNNFQGITEAIIGTSSVGALYSMLRPTRAVAYCYDLLLQATLQSVSKLSLYIINQQYLFDTLFEETVGNGNGFIQVSTDGIVTYLLDEATIINAHTLTQLYNSGNGVSITDIITYKTTAPAISELFSAGYTKLEIYKCYTLAELYNSSIFTVSEIQAIETASPYNYDYSTSVTRLELLISAGWTLANISVICTNAQLVQVVINNNISMSQLASIRSNPATVANVVTINGTQQLTLQNLYNNGDGYSWSTIIQQIGRNMPSIFTIPNIVTFAIQIYGYANTTVIADNVYSIQTGATTTDRPGFSIYELQTYYILPDSSTPFDNLQFWLGYFYYPSIPLSQKHIDDLNASGWEGQY